MYKILITYLVLSFNILNFSLNAMSIDQQISKIKNAPASQRVQLMNQFKQNLAHMNQKQRLDAINGLRAKMSQGNRNIQMNKANNIHQRMPQIQMRQSQDMSINQNMNQVQIGQQHPHFDAVKQQRPDAQKPNFMKRR